MYPDILHRWMYITPPETNCVNEIHHGVTDLDAATARLAVELRLLHITEGLAETSITDTDGPNSELPIRALQSQLDDMEADELAISDATSVERDGSDTSNDSDDNTESENAKSEGAESD